MRRLVLSSRSRLVPVIAWACLAAATAPALRAQDNWLPPNVVEGLSRQLMGRLEAAAGKPAADREAALRATRARVQSLRTVIQAWSIAGVVGRAPKPADLALPSTSDEYLDALARYHLCNVVLFEQHENGRTVQERQVSALALTGLTVVQARLLAPYRARGGNEAAVEALLTGAQMAAVAATIQNDAAARSRVQAACGPVVGDLLDMMK